MSEEEMKNSGAFYYGTTSARGTLKLWCYGAVYLSEF
jgi:hypothetical protein